jgi:alpha-ribazole phosphatase
MDVFLIRHTRTAAESGVCYGFSDVTMPSDVSRDIECTLARLPRFDVVHTSPAQRCMLLAAALGLRDRCVPIVSPELRELNFGAWEGRHWQDIAREESDVWARDTWNRAPPGGETEHALWQRVQLWHERRVRAVSGQRVAIIAHAGPLRILRCLLLNLPTSQRWEWTLEPGEAAAFASKS